MLDHELELVDEFLTYARHVKVVHEKRQISVVEGAKHLGRHFRNSGYVYTCTSEEVCFNAKSIDERSCSVAHVGSLSNGEIELCLVDCQIRKAKRIGPR